MCTGSDPLSAIYSFRPSNAELQPKSIVTLSLGQGQGPVAEEAILNAARDGGWVILQNCHLAEKWMVRLVNLWEEEIQSVKVCVQINNFKMASRY